MAENKSRIQVTSTAEVKVNPSNANELASKISKALEDKLTKSLSAAMDRAFSAQTFQNKLSSSITRAITKGFAGVDYTKLTKSLEKALKVKPDTTMSGSKRGGSKKSSNVSVANGVTDPKAQRALDTMYKKRGQLLIKEVKELEKQEKTRGRQLIKEAKALDKADRDKGKSLIKEVEAQDRAAKTEAAAKQRRIKTSIEKRLKRDIVRAELQYESDLQAQKKAEQADRALRSFKMYKAHQRIKQIDKEIATEKAAAAAAEKTQKAYAATIAEQVAERNAVLRSLGTTSIDGSGRSLRKTKAGDAKIPKTHNEFGQERVKKTTAQLDAAAKSGRVQRLPAGAKEQISQLSKIQGAIPPAKSQSFKYVFKEIAQGIINKGFNAPFQEIAKRIVAVRLPQVMADIGAAVPGHLKAVAEKKRFDQTVANRRFVERLQEAGYGKKPRQERGPRTVSPSVAASAQQALEDYEKSFLGSVQQATTARGRLKNLDTFLNKSDDGKLHKILRDAALKADPQGTYRTFEELRNSAVNPATNPQGVKTEKPVKLTAAERYFQQSERTLQARAALGNKAPNRSVNQLSRLLTGNKSEDDSITKRFLKVSPAVDKATGKFKLFNRELNNVDLAARKLASLYIVFRSIQAIKFPLQQLINFQSTIEQLRFGFAETLSVSNRLFDNLDREINTMTQLKVSFVEADVTMRSLIKNAIKYGLDIESLGESFAATAGAARSGGVSLEDSAQIITELSVLSKRLNIPLNVVARDVRDIFTGLNVSRTILGNILGLHQKMIVEWRTQGTLAENLKKKLELVGLTMEENLTTFDGLRLSIRAVLNDIGIQLFGKLFQQLKDGLSSVREVLVSLNTPEGIRGATEQMEKMIEHAQTFARIIGGIQIARHITLPLSRSLGGSKQSLSSRASAFINSGGAIRQKVGLSVAGALGAGGAALGGGTAALAAGAVVSGLASTLATALGAVLVLTAIEKLASYFWNALSPKFSEAGNDFGSIVAEALRTGAVAQRDAKETGLPIGLASSNLEEVLAAKYSLTTLKNRFSPYTNKRVNEQYRDEIASGTRRRLPETQEELANYRVIVGNNRGAFNESELNTALGVFQQRQKNIEDVKNPQVSEGIRTQISNSLEAAINAYDLAIGNGLDEAKNKSNFQAKLVLPNQNKPGGLEEVTISNPLSITLKEQEALIKQKVEAAEAKDNILVAYLQEQINRKDALAILSERLEDPSLVNAIGLDKVNEYRKQLSEIVNRTTNYLTGSSEFQTEKKHAKEGIAITRVQNAQTAANAVASIPAYTLEDIEYKRKELVSAAIQSSALDAKQKNAGLVAARQDNFYPEDKAEGDSLIALNSSLAGQALKLELDSINRNIEKEQADFKEKAFNKELDALLAKQGILESNAKLELQGLEDRKSFYDSVGDERASLAISGQQLQIENSLSERLSDIITKKKALLDIKQSELQLEIATQQSLYDQSAPGSKERLDAASALVPLKDLEVTYQNSLYELEVNLNTLMAERIAGQNEYNNQLRDTLVDTINIKKENEALAKGVFGDFLRGKNPLKSFTEGLKERSIQTTERVFGNIISGKQTEFYNGENQQQAGGVLGTIQQAAGAIFGGDISSPANKDYNIQAQSVYINGKNIGGGPQGAIDSLTSSVFDSKQENKESSLLDGLGNIFGGDGSTKNTITDKLGGYVEQAKGLYDNVSTNFSKQGEGISNAISGLFSKGPTSAASGGASAAGMGSEVGGFGGFSSIGSAGGGGMTGTSSGVGLGGGVGGVSGASGGLGIGGAGGGQAASGGGGAAAGGALLVVGQGLQAYEHIRSTGKKQRNVDLEKGRAGQSIAKTNKQGAKNLGTAVVAGAAAGGPIGAIVGLLAGIIALIVTNVKRPKTEDIVKTGLFTTFKTLGLPGDRLKTNLKNGENKSDFNNFSDTSKITQGRLTGSARSFRTLLPIIKGTKGGFKDRYVSDALIRNAQSLGLSEEDLRENISLFSQQALGGDFRKGVLKIQSRRGKRSNDNPTQRQAALGEAINAFTDLPESLNTSTLALELMTSKGGIAFERFKRVIDSVKGSIEGIGSAAEGFLTSGDSGDLSKGIGDTIVSGIRKRIVDRIQEQEFYGEANTNIGTLINRAGEQLAAGDREGAAITLRELARLGTGLQSSIINKTNNAYGSLDQFSSIFGVGGNTINGKPLSSNSVPTFTTVPGDLNEPKIIEAHGQEKIRSSSQEDALMKGILAINDKIGNNGASVGPIYITALMPDGTKVNLPVIEIKRGKMATANPHLGMRS